MTFPREFRPEKTSRTGELILWILTFITVTTLVFLWSKNSSVSFWQISFVVVMVLISGGSSLSTWMERNTVLTLKSDGVGFRNGLRNVTFNWDKIKELRIYPSRYGNRIIVFGERVNFNFRTMVEVTTRTGKRNTMGFAQGEYISQQIIQHCGFQERKENDSVQYYYRP
jgi:hypothetical protein